LTWRSREMEKNGGLSSWRKNDHELGFIYQQLFRKEYLRKVALASAPYCSGKLFDWGSGPAALIGSIGDIYQQAYRIPLLSYSLTFNITTFHNAQLPNSLVGSTQVNSICYVCPAIISAHRLTQDKERHTRNSVHVLVDREGLSHLYSKAIGDA
jgi:hypothetical protein